MTTTPRTRVRGMYATAITQLLVAVDMPVVAPSGPIAERFEARFPDALPDVTVRATDDRQGVRIQGDAAGVTRVAEQLSDVSLDTFRWDADLPQAAVYVGRVGRTGESGASVDLGDASGFLPYGESSEHINRADPVIVQVIDPEPPWSVGRRPVVSAIPRAPGTYLDLVSDDRALTAPTEELRGLVDLLTPELPAGWRIAAQRTAEGADLETLESELERLTAVAECIDQAVDDAASGGGEPRRVDTILETSWCRFGRAGRFELDEHRRAVSPTVDGHHRVKTGGASLAVDFLERVCDEMPEFDADAVIDTFGPELGDQVRIEHCRPTGEAVTLGVGTVTERSDGGAATVRRELSGGGRLDALEVPKTEGDVAETIFVEGRQWYPTVYRDDDDAWKGTYVNVCTPLEIYPEVVRYVDLYVDVIKDVEGTVRIVDEDELDEAAATGLLPKSLVSEASQIASALERSFG